MADQNNGNKMMGSGSRFTSSRFLVRARKRWGMREYPLVFHPIVDVIHDIVDDHSIEGHGLPSTSKKHLNACKIIVSSFEVPSPFAAEVVRKEQSL